MRLFDIAVKFEFGPKQRQRFYIKLAQLLENGVSLDMSLQQLYTLAYQKNKKSILPKLFARWRQAVANGLNFGKVMGPFVPSTEAILLETGADTGYLVDALYNAADTVEQQGKVKNAIVSNASYPVVLLCMLLAALILSTYQVIPTFAEILPVEKWQGASAIVAQASMSIRDYGMIILSVVIIMFVLVVVSLPRWTSPSRRYVENVIPWNLYRMWQGSSFLLSISALMKAGVKLDEVSLNRIGRNADPYLAQRISAVKKWIISGANLGEALYKAGYNFPENEIIADLRVYAKLRGFDQNLIRITRTWVGELVVRVEAIMKVLNVVVLFLIALVIGFMISSLYGVVQQIQQTS